MARDFLLAENPFRPAVGSTQPPVMDNQEFPGSNTAGTRRRTPTPSSAEDKNEWSYTSVPPSVLSRHVVGKNLAFCFGTYVIVGPSGRAV